MKHTDRVVFFSKQDMASGWMLSKAEKILDSFDENRIYTDINDIMELYHIKLYIDADLFLSKWDESKISLYNSYVSKIWSIINCFLGGINDNNIETYYQNIDDWQFHDSFWTLVDKCKIYKQIDKIVFKKLITNTSIRDVLENKNIVAYCDQILKDFLVAYEESAEILLSKYEQDTDSHNATIYLPKSLSIEDKNSILDRYIDSPHPNFNYLDLIVIAKNTDDFKVPDKIRLKAKKTAKIKTEEILANNSSCIGYQIGFFNDQADPVKINRESNNLIFSYSGSWIKRHCDTVSLFQNFAFLFGMLDRQSRISLVSKESERSFVDTIGLQSRNKYVGGMEFESKNGVALMQIMGYSHFLEKNNVFIEDVIKDTFNEYCQAMGIENFNISFPSKDSTKLEKIRFLLPEMESLIKKYKMYVEDRAIDPELLSISSTPCRIQDIPSINKNKYVYGVKDKIGWIQHCFFSDQSVLYYIKSHTKEYHSLVDLLVKENVKLSDLENCQLSVYQQLINEQYLKVKDGYIRINKELELSVYKELYNNEVVSYHYLSQIFKAMVDDLHSMEFVEFGDTLLSKSEISYFNYCLNKLEYTNGLDLRNKYAHGTHHNSQMSIDDDYYRVLILLTLLVWKIIDDINLSQISTINNSVVD